MAKEYKHQGETFLLNDSKGCYVKVTYKDQVGYLGVNLQGSAESPYCWWDDGDRPVTPDGLRFGNSNSVDEEGNLRALCGSLLRRHKQAEARKVFNPKEVCHSLHEFVKGLPG